MNLFKSPTDQADKSAYALAIARANAQYDAAARAYMAANPMPADIEGDEYAVWAGDYAEAMEPHRWAWRAEAELAERLASV